MVQTQKLMEKTKAGVRPARVISKVGIIGAGQMGSGIAHVVALSGYNVAINDLKKEAFDKGLEAVGKNLARQIAKGAIQESDRDKALERISFAPNFEAFGDCDLVIEAATEDEALKHKIFAALCPHLKPTAMLASNTSSISITRLAATTDRPEDFIGMHFMNPVPLMELVELIRGIATEDETFSTAKAFVERGTACSRTGFRYAVTLARSSAASGCHRWSALTPEPRGPRPTARAAAGSR